MKNIIITERLKTIVFLVILSFCSHASAKGKLTITIKDCRNIENPCYLAEIKILKDNSEFKTITPKRENKQELMDLEYGNYTLIYKSFFNKIDSINVNIRESKDYSVELCLYVLDYSKETYKPIIDRLQVDEFYSIIISSTGCFHDYNDTITINKNNEVYILTWGSNSKTLLNSDIEAIRRFELELNYMSNALCTTTDTYILIYNGIERQIIDGSCEWNMHYNLRAKLFGE